MDFKKIEKAGFLFEKIKNIDLEIIEIDKACLLILNNETSIGFGMHIENLSKNQEDKKNVEINSDGDLIIGKKEELKIQAFFPMTGLFQQIENVYKKPENTFAISKIITDKLALSCLGSMLHHKKLERKNLIKEIEKLGFK